MKKYKNIEKLRDDFITALQIATRQAQNEKEYDALADIAADAMAGIPITLLQKDWWSRESIRQRIPETMQNDTESINHLMHFLHQRDAIAFVGDDFIENLDDDIDKAVEIVRKTKGK